MPSYAFVSTANAVALRGGIPRFIDIREDTLNIDEKCIERAINKKTKAIFPMFIMLGSLVKWILLNL